MIVVPPPPPPSSSIGPAAVAAVLPLTDAPALLRSAPLGAILQGMIASNAPGALVVQTAQGQISLAVTLAGLKVGQPVTLTLQPGSGNSGQVLIQADRPATPGVATVSDLLPNIQSGAQPARPGAVVQATVIRAGAPPPGEAPLQNAPAPATGAAPASPPATGSASGAAVAPASLLPAPPGAAQTPAAVPSTGQPVAQPTVQPSGAASPAAANPQTPAAAAPPPSAAPTPPAAPLPQTPLASTPIGQAAPPPSQAATSAPNVTQPAAAPATAAPAPSATPTAPAPAGVAPAPSATTSAPPPPAVGPTVTSAATPPQAAPQAAPAARTDAAQTPGFLLGASNGDRVPVRVVALLPAGATAIPTAPAPAGTTVVTLATPLPTAASVATPGGSLASTPLAPGNFVGVVVGASANGSAIVQAGAGLMTLEGVSAPANSALVLAPATVRGQAPPPAPVNNAALAAALPGVAELINAADATGGPAQAAMQAILPRLGPQMAAGMVFFMRALRTGDLNEWLGKDARTAIERSGRASSVKKAAADLEQTARANERNAEWSSYPIPVGVGGQRVEPIRLFVRHAEEDGGQGGSKGGKEKPTRFLIDVTLSRLGRIQLDGLARLPKLDLVLRSEAPLNPALQQPLRRFFADVTSARGIQGEMNFQVAPPIDPTAAAPPKARPGIMV